MLFESVSSVVVGGLCVGTQRTPGPGITYDTVFPWIHMERISMLFTELDRRLSLSNNNQNKRKYKEENKKCRKNRREKQRDFDKKRDNRIYTLVVSSPFLYQQYPNHLSCTPLQTCHLQQPTSIPKNKKTHHLTVKRV